MTNDEILQLEEQEQPIGAICSMISEFKIATYPCPNCGSFTYLGVLIPTVEMAITDYYPTEFTCQNPDCGAYWNSEDKYYYTPENSREDYYENH